MCVCVVLFCVCVCIVLCVCVCMWCCVHVRVCDREGGECVVRCVHVLCV